MPSVLLALSLAVAGQIAPPLGPPGQSAPAPAARPAPAPVQTQATQSPSNDEIYQAAKKLLNEAKLKAMQKDLSLRSKALKANQEAAMKTLCQRFSITPKELQLIIEIGEEKDGTSSKKQAKSNATKNALKQQNLMMLGAMEAEIESQAAAMAAQSAARVGAGMPDLRRNAASANAQLRRNTIINGYETLGRPIINGPR